jgi:LemA protein
MSKAVGCGIAVVAILVICGLMGVGQFNGLVGAEQGVNEAWAQVENTYQRRADLIPNLVATVKGMAEFEQETLQNVVEARSRVGQISGQATEQILNDPAKFAQFQQAQDGLSSALSRLLVVMEKYPELKATEGYSNLMTQLEGTENRITVERKRFNEVARDFNTRLQKFPTNLFDRLLGWHFEPRPYFAAQAGAETAPKVEF